LDALKEKVLIYEHIRIGNMLTADTATGLHKFSEVSGRTGGRFWLYIIMDATVNGKRHGPIVFKPRKAVLDPVD